MATTVMFRLLLAVCCSVVCSAWLFKKGGGIQLADYRNCFCKAVNNLNYADIRRDFGSIQRCRGFPTCGCRRSAMMTCGTQCDRKVKEWVCHHNCGGIRASVVSKCVPTSQLALVIPIQRIQYISVVPK